MNLEGNSYGFTQELAAIPAAGRPIRKLKTFTRSQYYSFGQK